MPTQEPLLSPSEVARRLGVHVETVRRLIRRGEIPGVFRFGGVIRISESALTTWLQSRSLAKSEAAGASNG